MEIVTTKKRRVDAYSFAQLKYKFLVYFNTGGFIKRRGTSIQPLKKPTATANENKYSSAAFRLISLFYFLCRFRMWMRSSKVWMRSRPEVNEI